MKAMCILDIRPNLCRQKEFDYSGFYFRVATRSGKTIKKIQGNSVKKWVFLKVSGNLTKLKKTDFVFINLHNSLFPKPSNGKKLTISPLKSN